MTNRLKLYLGGGLLVAGIGVAVFVLSQFAAGDEPAVTVEGQLLASSRSNLSLCVDGAGGFSVSSREVEAVREALARGLASVPDVPDEYAEPNVVAGCPPATGLTGTPVNPLDRIGGLILTGGEAPSPHFAFIYFVPAEAYGGSFGSQPYGRTHEESICRGDVCFSGVTAGLYLSPSVTSEVLQQALLHVLNWPPRTPVPQDEYIDWEACERGELPHPELTCDVYWQRKTKEAPREQESQ